MEIHKPFYDLCVEEVCCQADAFINIKKKLIKFGFKTIAINQVITDAMFESQKQQKINDLVPEPISFYPGNEGLVILNRLTIEYSDRDIINRVVNSQHFKKFHIVALSPKTTEAFQFACDAGIGDIISFNPVVSKRTKFNRQSYNMALAKGLYFELNYVPTIQDYDLRRSIISRSHLYHIFGKSKNVIITSGAVNKYSFRGPYDIANLALILGLSEEQSKSAISTTCADLLKRAAGRKMGKSLIFVKTIQQPQVIELDADEDDMETDEPLQKKTKK